MIFTACIGLPYACLKPATIPRLCKPFSSSARIVHRYGHRSIHQAPRPRSWYRGYSQYGQKNSYQPPGWFDMNMGKIICGGLILACAGVSGYHSLLRQEVVTHYSNKARDDLVAFRKHFVMSYEAIEKGRYYTILTSALNHDGILHFGFNMVGLWSFGRPTIALFGPTMFAFLLTGSVLAGGAAQYYWWRKSRDFHAGAVGASGGVFGLVAAQTFITPLNTIVVGFLPMPYWAGLSISVAASIAGMQGYWGSGIAHADHLGGMAFGALFWLLVLRRRPMGGLYRYYY